MLEKNKEETLVYNHNPLLPNLTKLVKENLVKLMGNQQGEDKCIVDLGGIDIMIGVYDNTYRKLIEEYITLVEEINSERKMNSSEIINLNNKLKKSIKKIKVAIPINRSTLIKAHKILTDFLRNYENSQSYDLNFLFDIKSIISGMKYKIDNYHLWQNKLSNPMRGQIELIRYIELFND